MIRSQAETAETIVGLCDYQLMREALVHWSGFVCYPQPIIGEDEGEIAYVERVFESLRTAAELWLVKRQIGLLWDAMTRLES